MTTTISGLPMELATADVAAADDYLEVEDVSAAVTKKVKPLSVVTAGIRDGAVAGLATIVEASVDAANDTLILHDISAGIAKRVTAAALVAAAGGGGGAADADAVAFDASGLAVISGTDVQAALEEVDAALVARAPTAPGATASVIANAVSGQSHLLNIDSPAGEPADLSGGPYYLVLDDGSGGSEAVVVIGRDAEYRTLLSPLGATYGAGPSTVAYAGPIAAPDLAVSDLLGALAEELGVSLPLTGGEMAGDITFVGAQTVDGVDVSTLPASIAAKLPLAGGELSGPVTLDTDGAHDIGTALKALRAVYTDAVRRGGGALELGVNPDARISLGNALGVLTHGGTEVMRWTSAGATDPSLRRITPGAPRPVTTGTATSTLVTDHGLGIYITSTTGAHTVTVDSHAVGTVIPVTRGTTSTVTLAAGSGVTIVAAPLFALSLDAGATCTLRYLTSTLVEAVGGREAA